MESVLNCFFFKKNTFFPSCSHLFLSHLGYEHVISTFKHTLLFLIWYRVHTFGLWCFCQIFPATIITHALEFLISLHKQKWQIPGPLANTQKWKKRSSIKITLKYSPNFYFDPIWKVMEKNMLPSFSWPL